MSPLQSVVVLLVVVALAFFPLVYRWAARREGASASLSSLLPAREAAARHLYGEAVAWRSEAMEDYDRSPRVQATWLREVDRRIGRRGLRPWA